MCRRHRPDPGDTPTPTPAIEPSAVREAARRIAGRLHRTPLVHCGTLDRLAGCTLLLKAENLQRTGSFKARGNLNRLLRLSDAERRRGVVAASAGNHAQGLAWAARDLGAPCTIVMPTTAPLAKLDATRAYGATVERVGTIYDDCEARAAAIAAASGMTLVHPCTDPDVVAGHGTVGLEILEEQPGVDIIVVPVGGGGLISGIALAAQAVRAAHPTGDPPPRRVRIVGVQPEGSAPMLRSLEAGHLVALDHVATIADGLAGREVYALTLDLVARWTEGIVLVSEQEMLDAMLLLMTRAKLVAEPSGAAGLAALLAGRVPVEPSSTVACVLSGGNQDPDLLARWIAGGVEGAAIAH
ncbi:MAG: threonine/serine dehydratase [Candidatus Eiseniibacteriota bacterium]|jgi:threonine dehydratase